MIYFLQEKSNGFVKVGYSRDEKGALRRLRFCSVFNPFEVSIVGLMAGDKEVEAQLHKEFSNWRIRGEWFKPCKRILELIEANPYGSVCHTDKLTDDEVKKFLDVCNKFPNRDTVLLQVIYYGKVKSSNLWTVNPDSLILPEKLKKEWESLQMSPVSDRHLRRIWDAYRPSGCKKGLIALANSYIPL